VRSRLRRRVYRQVSASDNDHFNLRGESLARVVVQPIEAGV
jgi:hypothetical protein